LQIPDRDEIAGRPVHVRGADRPFGELTLDDARSRAAELRSATGWGPTAKVASIARAWRELALTMEKAGAKTVNDLDPEVMAELAPKLWVVPPGGSFL
jgi:hypothetical protein